MASPASSRPVTIHVIGFGSVGQALHRMLLSVHARGQLAPITRVRFFAPEITAHREEGVFSFHPCPAVDRDSLTSVLDLIGAAPGDILAELATRIDTVTIWKAAKARGLHFMNSGFDVWGDVVLDLGGLDELKRDAVFSAGSGPTSVFSMGMNPGVVNHFVRYGLQAATGIADAREAAKAFGLRSMVFSERDTQWPRTGSAGEKLMAETQSKVLYNTWSPGNYIVETAESTLLWVGVPEGAKDINAASPTLTGWVPSGPILGFAPPHDECFTVQPWFDREIPALFVYEASPPARAYLKGGHAEESSKAVCKLLTPGPYDIRDDCYDMIGVVMFSDKPGTAPFWCGLNMTVADAAAIDPTRSAGPTPMEVTGGVWSALQYILQFPTAGDCFPEDLPSEFVMKTAFPWCGRLSARPCPEALKVAGIFEPAAANALEIIKAGTPDSTRFEVRASPIHGNGAFATAPLLPATALVQLPLDGVVVHAPGFVFNHSCDPNAYLDRNRAIRTLRAVAAGEEITVDYAMTATRAVSAAAASVGWFAACSCGAAQCRRTVKEWTSLTGAQLHQYLETAPIDREVEEDIYGALGPKSF